MIRATSCVLALLALGACDAKQGAGMNTKSVASKTATVDSKILLIEAERKILSSSRYTSVDCPSYFGATLRSTERLCFAGVGEAEEFINFFTPDIAKLGSGKVYWNRDSGLWLSKFDLKDSAGKLVVGLMMKGDSDFIGEDPKFDKFDMLIDCTLFLNGS